MWCFQEMYKINKWWIINTGRWREGVISFILLYNLIHNKFRGIHSFTLFSSWSRVFHLHEIRCLIITLLNMLKSFVTYFFPIIASLSISICLYVNTQLPAQHRNQKHWNYQIFNYFIATFSNIKCFKERKGKAIGNHK